MHWMKKSSLLIVLMLAVSLFLSAFVFADERYNVHQIETARTVLTQNGWKISDQGYWYLPERIETYVNPMTGARMTQEQPITDATPKMHIDNAGRMYMERDYGVFALQIQDSSNIPSTTQWVAPAVEDTGPLPSSAQITAAQQKLIKQLGLKQKEGAPVGTYVRENYEGVHTFQADGSLFYAGGNVDRGIFDWEEYVSGRTLAPEQFHLADEDWEYDNWNTERNRPLVVEVDTTLPENDLTGSPEGLGVQGYDKNTLPTQASQLDESRVYVIETTDDSGNSIITQYYFYDGNWYFDSDYPGTANDIEGKISTDAILVAFIAAKQNTKSIAHVKNNEGQFTPAQPEPIVVQKYFTLIGEQGKTEGKLFTFADVQVMLSPDSTMTEQKLDELFAKARATDCPQCVVSSYGRPQENEIIVSFLNSEGMKGATIFAPGQEKDIVTGSSTKIQTYAYTLSDAGILIQNRFDSSGNLRESVFEKDGQAYYLQSGVLTDTYYKKVVDKNDKGVETIEYVKVEGQDKVALKQFVEDNKIAESIEAAEDAKTHKDFEQSRADAQTQSYSQRIVDILDEASRSASAFSGYSSLFMSEKERNDWLETRDQFFADHYLGTQYWASGICKSQLDVPNKQVAFYDNPVTGRTRLSAYVSGVRITALDNGEFTQFLYKFEYYVNNPRNSYADSSNDRDVDAMCFNVVLQPGDVHLYNESYCLGGGEVAAQAGRSAIVRYSISEYTEICLELENAPPLSASTPLCNKIVFNPTTPTTFPPPTVISGNSTEGGNQGGRRTPQLNGI